MCRGKELSHMPEQEKILDELIERYPVLAICKMDIWQVYLQISECFMNGGKLLTAGNGGSAADAEHIVGELMKGFVKHRYLDRDMQDRIMEIDSELGKELNRNLQKTLPAIALTGNVALSTACLNDINGTIGFAQQIFGYGREKDVFMGITTSGNSQNILNAIVTAKAKGLKTVVLTGRDGGRAKAMADLSIVVPEKETYKIQELHLPIYHALCLMLEDRFFEL